MTETTLDTSVLTSGAVDLSTLPPATLAALIAQVRQADKAAKVAAREEADERRQAHAYLCDEMRPHVQHAADVLLTFRPAAPSAKEGSTWVGSVVSGVEIVVDGVTYSASLTLKDVAASEARKAAAEG